MSKNHIKNVIIKKMSQQLPEFKEQVFSDVVNEYELNLDQVVQTYKANKITIMMKMWEEQRESFN